MALTNAEKQASFSKSQNANENKSTITPATNLYDNAFFDLDCRHIELRSSPVRYRESRNDMPPCAARCNPDLPLPSWSPPTRTNKPLASI
jgi:hypothetical protein